jgi:hypothetical protein
LLLNLPESSSYGHWNAIQPVGNLSDTVPLKLKDRDFSEPLIELTQHDFALFGGCRNEGGSRLVLENAGQPGIRCFVGVDKDGFTSHIAVTPFLGMFTPKLCHRLASRDGHQQSANVVSVSQVGEPPSQCSSAETVKRTEGNILFVCDATPTRFQL